MSIQDDLTSEQIFNKLEEYMFTRGNMAKYNKVFSTMIVEKIKEEKRIKEEEAQDLKQEQFRQQLLHLQQQLLQHQSSQKPTVVTEPVPSAPLSSAPLPLAPLPLTPLPLAPLSLAPLLLAPLSSVPSAHVKKSDTQFTPFQKDTLFWCFYIILNGFEEYELHNSDHFATEKNFKIATVEKMRSMKDKFKEAKLKINEIEDELANKQVITLKGLHALCLVHEVSITYIYGRKYCEFLYKSATSSSSSSSGSNNGTGVIVYGKKTNSVKYDVNEDYMAMLSTTFWKIDNVQKPLASPGSYSVKELQDICTRLEIPITNSETGKNKLKTVLYEDILGDTNQLFAS